MFPPRLIKVSAHNTFSSTGQARTYRTIKKRSALSSRVNSRLKCNTSSWGKDFEAGAEKALRVFSEPSTHLLQISHTRSHVPIYRPNRVTPPVTPELISILSVSVLIQGFPRNTSRSSENRAKIFTDEMSRVVHILQDISTRTELTSTTTMLRR